LIKQTRNPEKFDVLELFSSMATTKGYKINDIHSVEEFISCVTDSIKESATNDRTKFGKRVESLFAYVAGALGHVKLLKQEDTGSIYYLGEEIIAPDYKVILKDNTQILIEVKNFYSPDIEKYFTIENDYYLKLKRYSDINKIPLKFAIYFSKMNQWFLLPISAFTKTENTFKINFITAMAKSEMAILGDRMIGTTPNLEIHLITNRDEASPINSSGIVGFTIRKTQCFCANQEVTNITEQKILFDFIRYGKWIEKDTEVIMDDDKFLGVKFIYAPTEVTEQPFEIIGLLSGMISNKFKELTTNDGKIELLDLGLNPNAFEILIPDGYDSSQLPLWQFIISANEDFEEEPNKTLERNSLP